MQFLTVVLYILLALTSLFLICLILIQRGKGGGLAGAFGGVGGSSAFGTKAGDVFTRVTMIAAGIWITLNMLLVVMSNRRPSAWANPPGQEAKSKFIPGKTGDPKSALPAAGESIDAPPAVPSPTPKTPATSPAGGAPAVPVSGGSPAVPPPLPAPPTPSPTPKPK